MLSISTALDIDRRKFERFAINGTVEAELMTAKLGKVTFIAVDVSRHGLGMVLSEAVMVGDVLVMNFPELLDLEIELKVMWVNSSSAKDQVWRCGLHVVGESRDLENLFRNLDGINLEEL